MEAGWDLHRSFLGVLRFGSLSAAARELGLTQPTLGRHIDALEATLGVKLFARGRHGLVPSPAALSLRPHAEAMEAAAAALARAASGESDAPSGAVRVTASVMIGAEVLPSILTSFREANPQIAVELVLSNRNQDLSRRDADIAVRMIRPAQKALIAKRLGTVRGGLYAHLRYLARHGTPRSLEELAGHALIGFDRDAGMFRALALPGGLPVTREIFALRSDDELAQLGALRAGFGIGGAQAGIAAREPDLVPVLPGALRFKLEMWLAMHQDLKGSRRVRLLFDHLAGALTAYAKAS
ncbi:MAG TPA: LysR family transcriptional regulator [Rhizomicrobium sp.]|nr:LysR family transcriptional regulator [Rhizomicrobium sp.]